MNNENQIFQPPVVFEPVSNGPRPDIIDKKDAVVLATGGLFTAVLYSICFTGVDVLPQTSFLLFCSIAIAVLYFGLKLLNWTRNKKAFLWAIPIIIIASFNAIFELSVFNYFNVCTIWLMFAMMSFTAIHEQKAAFGNINLWINLIRTIFGNWIAPFEILAKAIDKKNIKKSTVPMRIMAGLVIALPLFLLILFLMLDADEVFMHFFNSIFDHLQLQVDEMITHGVAILIAATYFTGYVFNIRHMKKSEEIYGTKKIDVVIATTFLSAINVLFLLFCIIQVAYLFTGNINTLPSGLVYSEYARQGFFQLLFITIINFTVIFIFLKLFPDCLQSTAVKTMLLLLCVFTTILIASSFYRMNLYIDVYGYTTLRMMVLTFLAMEAVWIVATLRAIYNPKLDIMNYYIYIGIVFYIAVNITGSGYFVNKLNIQKYYYDSSYQIDLDIIKIDNANDLIQLYDATGDAAMKQNINRELNSIARQNANDENENQWQNASLLKNKNIETIKQFLSVHPYAAEPSHSER